MWTLEIIYLMHSESWSANRRPILPGGLRGVNVSGEKSWRGLVSGRLLPLAAGAGSKWIPEYLRRAN